MYTCCGSVCVCVCMHTFVSIEFVSMFHCCYFVHSLLISNCWWALRVCMCVHANKVLFVACLPLCRLNSLSLAQFLFVFLHLVATPKHARTQTLIQSESDWYSTVKRLYECIFVAFAAANVFLFIFLLVFASFIQSSFLYLMCLFLVCLAVFVFVLWVYVLSVSLIFL